MAPRLVFLALLINGCGGPGDTIRVSESVLELGGHAVSVKLAEPAPGRANDVGVLLLHREGESHVVWDGFIQHLANLGYTVAAPTLPQEFTLTQSRALFSAILRKHFAGRRVAAVGEGRGAALAVAWGMGVPEVDALVLMSPALSEREVDTLALMREFTHCPVFLVASDGDARSATAAMQLKDAAPAFCEIQLYPGSALGSDLFGFRPQTMTTLTDWLAQILAPAAPPV
ncbi:MAG: hypothetical protein RLZZ303_1453 [Candidatus Hydrogenedentota bacterium]